MKQLVLDSEYMKLSKAKNISQDQNNNSLLELCGQWKDDRTAEEIVDEIYSTRTSSKNSTLDNWT